MRKSARNRIIIWSVISGLLVAVLVCGMMASSTFLLSPKIKIFGVDENIDNYSSGDCTFDMDKIKSLDINWTSGNIVFENGNSNKIVISEESVSALSDNEKMKYKLTSEGVLKIYSTTETNFLNLFGSDVNKKLTIKIPDSKILNEVEISTASADIEADKLNAKSISTETASGKVTLSDVNGEDFSADTASGDIYVAGNITDKVTVNTVSAKCMIQADCEKADLSGISGNINAELGINAEEVSVETVSGEIEITFPKSISGLNAQHSSVSGDFSSEFVGSLSDNVFECGDGSVDVDLQTVSGSIKILKAE